MGCWYPDHTWSSKARDDPPDASVDVELDEDEVGASFLVCRIRCARNEALY